MDLVKDKEKDILELSKVYRLIDFYRKQGKSNIDERELENFLKELNEWIKWTIEKRYRYKDLLIRAKDIIYLSDKKDLITNTFIKVLINPQIKVNIKRLIIVILPDIIRNKNLIKKIYFRLLDNSKIEYPVKLKILEILKKFLELDYLNTKEKEYILKFLLKEDKSINFLYRRFKKFKNNFQDNFVEYLFQNEKNKNILINEFISIINKKTINENEEWFIKKILKTDPFILETIIKAKGDEESKTLNFLKRFYKDLRGKICENKALIEKNIAIFLIEIDKNYDVVMDILIDLINPYNLDYAYEIHSNLSCKEKEMINNMLMKFIELDNYRYDLIKKVNFIEFLILLGKYDNRIVSTYIKILKNLQYSCYFHMTLKIIFKIKRDDVWYITQLIKLLNDDINEYFYLFLEDFLKKKIKGKRILKFYFYFIFYLTKVWYKIKEFLISLKMV